MKVLNAIPRENAADYRRVLNGKDLKTLKRKKGPKLLLSEFSAVKHNGALLVVQRAISFDPAMWHHTDLPQWRKNQLIQDERDGTINYLLHSFPKWAADPAERARVRHIDFVRIGGRGLAKHDNLRTAFKYVVDGTCGVVLWGFDVIHRTRHEIGQADDRLEGVKWSYLQEKSQAQPRGYAIQIRLHCAPLTTE